MRALYKDIWMEIKKTRQRFLSIFFIVALGVAFFSGVRATNPDMRLTADTYIDAHQLLDIRIISTLGFGTEDLEFIQQMDEVEDAQGAWFADVLCTSSSSELVLQLQSAMEGFNKIEVTRGRMPVRVDECLIDTRLAQREGIKIGDILELSSGTDENLEDTITTTKLEVVGIGNHAGYIALTRGSTTIGDGEIKGFVIVQPELFVSNDVYTQICIRVKDSIKLLSHSQEYDDLIERFIKQLEGIEKEQCQIRYETVKNELTKSIADAKVELEDGKQTAQEEFHKAEQELLDAQNKLEDGKKELASKEQELLDGEQALEDAKKQLENAKSELTAGESQMATGKAQLQANEITLKMAKEQVAEGEYQLALLKAMYPSALISIEQLDQQIADGEKALGEGKAQIAAAEAQIAAAKAQMQAGEVQMESAKVQIASGEQEIAENSKLLEEGKVQIADAKKTLEQGEQELKDGWEEFYKQKAEVEQELRDGEVQLADAQQMLEDLEVPEWYIMNRNDYPDFITVGQNADRIGAIGEVFPVIFFIIAALVSLTTMTRMVEEQRTQIGTMKALGYSKWNIAAKYMIYAFAATLGGSVLGVLIGEKVIPYVIVISYGIMYLPLRHAVCPYNMYYGVLGGGLALACTLGATLFSCFHALQSVPAQLMRPVAPKQGKRVLLEHIPFIWKKMNFGQKAAMRNLFRYKKRFFMTLFGIGSCTALLIVGFGIRDSIMNIGVIQYSNIQLYDGILQMKTDVSNEEQSKLQDAIASMEEVRASTQIYMKTMEVTANDVVREAYVCVPKSPEEFAKMNQFRSRTIHDTYELTDEGVILTEQMANALGVQKGDTVTLKSGEDQKVQVTVANITENYMMHYVYMTPTYYESLYKETPEYSVILYDLTEEGLEKETKIGQQILEYEAAYGLSYVSDSKASVDTMLSTLNVVIVVLIVSAGLLAYIVVYNLNNINITERRRELATLKVLGFYDSEVAAYVYRENIVLTLLGILMGCVMGKALHQFVILTVEVDMVMFGREIMNLSYVYSGLLTMFFAAIVNWIMFYKLKEINMVESLKSVE